MDQSLYRIYYSLNLNSIKLNFYCYMILIIFIEFISWRMFIELIEHLRETRSTRIDKPFNSQVTR